MRSRHSRKERRYAVGPQEAARLAIVLPSPRRYNPLSGSDYIEGRVREVLGIIVKRGIVTPEEARN